MLGFHRSLQSPDGGKLIEITTQALARQVLGETIARVEGTETSEVIVQLHDPLAAEVDEGTGSVEEFCDVMPQRPALAPGPPLMAAGYRDTRFRG